MIPRTLREKDSSHQNAEILNVQVSIHYGVTAVHYETIFKENSQNVVKKMQKKVSQFNLIC